VKGSTCSGLDTPAAISAQPGQQEGQHPLTGQCAANFRLLANQWAECRLVTQWRHGCRAMRCSVWNAGASNAGRSLAFRYQGNGATPCQYIDTTRKAIDKHYNFATASFYIMKLCSRLFVLYCWNCPNDYKYRYFIPISRKLGATVETWLMARWKARVEFLLSVSELLFPSLAVEALQGKMCQNSLPSGGGRSLGAYISGGRTCPPANILIPLERQLIVLQLCCWQFLYNETLQQNFHPVLSKLFKRRQI